MSKDTGGSKSQFSALLDDIAATDETLAKSLDTTDDAAIAAAAAEGGADTETGEAGDGKVAGKDGEETLGKSLKVTGDDGQEHDAIDATEFLKSLRDDVDGLVSVVTKLVGSFKAEATLVKSLQGDVAKLGVQGRGRKSVIVMHERPGSATETLTKSLGGEGGGEAEKMEISRETFLAKSLELANAGALSHRDVNHAETLINHGQSPQPHVLAAVRKALEA